MASKKVPIKSIALGCGALFLLSLLLYFALHLRLYEMQSPSMEPVIHGRSRPASADGDYVLVWKSFKTGALQRGDLVAITFRVEGRPVTTIRRIQSIPGDVNPNSAAPEGVETIPKDYFYISALTTNGLDSRSFGLMSASGITGKVIKIFHNRQ